MTCPVCDSSECPGAEDIEFCPYAASLFEDIDGEPPT